MFGYPQLLPITYHFSNSYPSDLIPRRLHAPFAVHLCLGSVGGQEGNDTMSISHSISYPILSYQ